MVYIKGIYNIVADTNSRLDYDKKSNICTINVRVRNLGTLFRSFNCCASKTTNSKALQTDDVYVPTGTHAFTNHLESVRNNYSVISDMSHADCEKSISTSVDNNHVKRYLKYLFVNTSKHRE